MPNSVRLNATSRVLSDVQTAAWSWILGHLPPPDNIDLHIVCPVVNLIKQRIDFKFNGAQWHCVRQRRFETYIFWLRCLFAIKPLINELKPDIIHGWGGERGYGFIATLLSRQSIVSVQGMYELLFNTMLQHKREMYKKSIRGLFVRFCEKLTYCRARVLLVESGASQQGLKEYYGKDGIIIPHPLRREFIETDISKRNNLRSYPITFVYLGCLIARKGAIDAVEAFASLSRQDAKLVMIGDGEARSKIEAISMQKGIKDRIVIAGVLSVDKIVDVFKTAQFFMLPSYGDTGPTALKEALSCGLYPICYDNSGPNDLIARYKCGTLVKTADVEGLAMSMRTCITNVEECIEKGLHAAQIVRQELSRSNVWKRLFVLYNANTCGH